MMSNVYRIKTREIVLLAWVVIAFVTWPTHAQHTSSEKDPRHIESGSLIPMKNYCDQPYVVITRDGNWLCVLTTGEGHEGSGGQHVAATISKDQGKTWSELVDIEPSSGPEASWVVPVMTPSGRVYAIYTYNGDKISRMPGYHRKIRADMLGWYCFKYTDDNGKTWSEKRYRIPIRTTAADRANQWKGEVNIFWGIDKPKISEMGVTFAFTKLGRYMLDNGEGWMMHSDNILTEEDPEKINWKLLPEGEHGVRLKKFGSIQEEFNHVVTGPDQMYMVYRTQTGYPCHTYSRDGGKTWTEPVHMTYSPDGRRIKNQRACPKLFKCENGKYLFWFHNHSRKSFFYRNPAWLTGGVVREGKMYWSEPEILLYHNDLPADDLRFNGSPMKLRGMSYPDLIEQDGRYWITETKKTVARVHEIDPALLEGMWAQLEGRGKVTKKSLVLDLQGQAARASEVEMPKLPDLSQNGGFSIDMKIKFEDNKEPSQLVIDSRNQDGCGLAVGVDPGGALNVYFSDGKHTGRWASDKGLLKPGQTHHVTAIVDGGPNIISFVVDGKFCDGGEQRIRGWGRFDPKIGDINGSNKLRLAPSFTGEILGLRIYDRYLRTSEAVANYQASLTPLGNTAGRRQHHDEGRSCGRPFPCPPKPITDHSTMPDLKFSKVIGPLLTGLLSLSPSLALEVTRVDIHERLYPDRWPETATTSAVHVPRGAPVTLQFALRSKEQGTANLSVRGEMPAEARIHWLESVHVEGNTQGSLINRPGGKVPDGWLDVLAREAPFDTLEVLVESDTMPMIAGRTHGVVIEIPVDRDTKPGRYQGELVVSLGSEQSAVPFSFEVHSTALPERQSLQSVHWLWPQPVNLTNGEVPEWWSERHWQLLEAAGKQLRRFGDDTVWTPLINFEEPLIQVTRRKDGTYAFDYSRFDRWAELFFGLGFRQLAGQHIVKMGEDVFVHDEATGNKMPLLKNPKDNEAWLAFLPTFYDSLHAHLKAKGWLDSYLQHQYDEPTDAGLYRRLSGLTRKHLPGVRTMDAIHVRANQFSPLVDELVFNLIGLNRHQKTAAQRNAQGKGVWLYHTTSPYPPHPNRHIDSQLAECRLYPWLAHKLGADGFLFWAANGYRGADEYKTSLGPFPPPNNNQNPGHPPGDNWFYYRSEDGLRPSIRIVSFREGLIDHALLTELTKRDAKKADKLVKRIAPSISKFERDPAVYQQMRATLLQQLDPDTP